jgi:hypothetical protein
MRDYIYGAIGYPQGRALWKSKGKPANKWAISDDDSAVKALRGISPKFFPSSVVLFISDVKVEDKDRAAVEAG